LCSSLHKNNSQHPRAWDTHLQAGSKVLKGLADIDLDVRGGDIIVDLPGTRYTVTYHKPAVSHQLRAAYLPGENDPRTKLTQAEFLARAWRLANEKARELEWIV